MEGFSDLLFLERGEAVPLLPVQTSSCSAVRMYEENKILFIYFRQQMLFFGHEHGQVEISKSMPHPALIYFQLFFFIKCIKITLDFYAYSTIIKINGNVLF